MGRAEVDGIETLSIYQSRGGLCGVCDEAVPFESAHWDHIVPKAKGGISTSTNLQPTHESCNALKADRSLSWARKRAMSSRNAVEEAVKQVGGALQAAALCNVRLATIYDWQEKGHIRLLAPALKLAAKSGIPVTNFAPPDKPAKR